MFAVAIHRMKHLSRRVAQDLWVWIGRGQTCILDLEKRIRCSP